MTTNAADRVGQTLAGRYLIEGLLGEGGMGAVYRAQHVHMRKQVAIKLLHREMSMLEEVRVRFEREAQAASRVDHPAIAKALDFGQLEDGTFYLALEFISGRSLDKRLRTEGALPQAEAARLVQAVADGLAHAHGAGIVHRDLKPDNVMLVRDQNGVEQPKILDFGIAKLSASDAREQPALTQLGAVFGTPDYMAPEQASGRPVDARADVYALGVIAYELLSGVNPFSTDDLGTTLVRQMTYDAPPLPESVHPELAALVHGMLVKSPEGRVQSAAEVCQRLTPLVGVPTSSPAVSLPPLSSGSVTQLPASARPSFHAEPASVGEAPTLFGLPSEAASAGSAPTSVALVASAQTQVLTSVGPGFGGSLAPRPPSTASDSARELVESLRRPVSVPGAGAAPLWVLLAGGAGVLALGLGVLVLLVTLFASPDSEARPAPRGDGASAPDVAGVPALDEARLRERAIDGDAPALRQLAELPGPADLQRYLALGHGHFARKDPLQGLAAYDRARQFPGASDDERLRRNVTRAALNPGAQAQALRLAAHLGAFGADLVYHVETETQGKPNATAAHRLAGELLRQDSLRAQASPALQVALDLDGARMCGDYAKVLPRAAEHADQRSLLKLRQLTARKGCGFLGLRDCWPCLRSGKALSQALERAAANPAPSFGE